MQRAPQLIKYLKQCQVLCFIIIVRFSYNDVSLQGALYGMAQSIPDRSLVSDIAALFFNGYYSTKLAKKEKSANGTM